MVQNIKFLHYFLNLSDTSSLLAPNIIFSIIFYQRGPLSLVSTTEELLDRKLAAPV
jgi:hypothetical protein